MTDTNSIKNYSPSVSLPPVKLLQILPKCRFPKKQLHQCTFPELHFYNFPSCRKKYLAFFLIDIQHLSVCISCLHMGLNFLWHNS